MFRKIKRSRLRLLFPLAILGFFAVPIWVNFFDWYQDSPENALHGTEANNEFSQPRLNQSLGGADRKLVWVMSYMRSGSSYISRSVLGSNPDVFFVYEPLASLYAAMYGVQMDMVVSTDVFTNKDGSVRNLPKHETNSVLWALNQVFTCNMTSFPTRMLGHVFWGWTYDVAETLYPCLSASGVNRGAIFNCWILLKKVCGSRLGELQNEQIHCYKNFWHQFYTSGFRNKQLSSQESPVNFTAFNNCWSTLEPIIRGCAHSFRKPCDRKRVIAVKTVRATMEMAEPLLVKYPQLHILYLYRDPRSVVRSRLQYPWSQGLFDGSNATLIARAYCQRVVRDYNEKRRLDKQYSSRLMTLAFDQFADNSMLNAKLVYDFLQLPFPEQNVWDYLMLRRKQKDPLEVRDKWRRELTVSQVNSIQTECAEFAKVTGFDWNKDE